MGILQVFEEIPFQVLGLGIRARTFRGSGCGFGTEGFEVSEFVAETQP